jgi:hypothetical protein
VKLRVNDKVLSRNPGKMSKVSFHITLFAWRCLSYVLDFVEPLSPWPFSRRFANGSARRGAFTISGLSALPEARGKKPYPRLSRSESLPLSPTTGEEMGERLLPFPLDACQM